MFESPRALLAWAHDDLAELERSMLDFYNEGACEHIREIDPETGEQHLKVRVKKPIPESWRRLASHALADIRHSCDQSMFAACDALSPKPIEDDVYFPWATHPRDLEAKMRRKDYIPEQIYPALRSLEPYPTGDGYTGGNDTIFEIRKLAGGNKHRVAIQPFTGVHQFSINGGPRRMILPYEGWSTDKQEITCAILHPAPGEEVKYDIHIVLGIAFGDVGPLEGQPVLGVLPFFGK